MKTNILADFQICISVPLREVRPSYITPLIEINFIIETLREVRPSYMKYLTLKDKIINRIIVKR